MEGTPLPSLKAKRAQNKQKKNPNLISYRSIFTRGSLCSRWTLQIQKTIVRIQSGKSVLFSIFTSKNFKRDTHTLPLPPRTLKGMYQKGGTRKRERWAHPTPPPLLLPFPHLYHGLFFQFITNRVFEKTFMCCWYEVRLRCNIDIFAQPPALLATSLDFPQTRAVSNLMKASNV